MKQGVGMGWGWGGVGMGWGWGRGGQGIFKRLSSRQSSLNTLNTVVSTLDFLAMFYSGPSPRTSRCLTQGPLTFPCPPLRGAAVLFPSVQEMDDILVEIHSE